ncbi:NUDIX domain-containing protein [Lysinibacillus capsici]|uniref:NUDIX domain-containing protein n=1 Tax=Lysinibacillus capsici TaxID=2115968 RepID=UPI002DB86339|nr:NUDIX domain-containing protein [Lysinibacillus capsici]MEC1304821.1 NUDIX domain-containing protein [Lysinibacillus capsici]
MDGAIREVEEEIGISLLRTNGQLVKSERRDCFNDFYDVWLFEQSFEISDTKLQEEEVTAVQWVTKLELENMLHANNVVPTLRYFMSIFNDKTTPC